MNMKHLIGKGCTIRLNVDGSTLFYTVKEVLDVTTLHISFVDKYDETYTYLLSDVVGVTNVKTL